MQKGKNMGLVAAGFLAGIMIGAPTAQAAVEYLQAYPSRNEIYVDGQQVQLEAYIINGTNYVKLRDIGQAVGFNVYWADAVQVDTTQDYTGQAPAKVVTLPTDGSRFIPAVSDQIPCPDGTTYTITDVTRWDKNASSILKTSSGVRKISVAAMALLRCSGLVVPISVCTWSYFASVHAIAS